MTTGVCDLMSGSGAWDVKVFCFFLSHLGKQWRSPEQSMSLCGPSMKWFAEQSFPALSVSLRGTLSCFARMRQCCCPWMWRAQTSAVGKLSGLVVLVLVSWVWLPPTVSLTSASCGRTVGLIPESLFREVWITCSGVIDNCGVVSKVGVSGVMLNGLLPK